jgi:hypothetical protein
MGSKRQANAEDQPPLGALTAVRSCDRRNQVWAAEIT